MAIRDKHVRRIHEAFRDIALRPNRRTALHSTHRHLGAAIASNDNGLVRAAAISLNHLCLGHDIDYSLTACVKGGKVANTALLNRNNALSVDPRQRTKELQDESELLIAKSRALRLRARELINQSHRMSVFVLRMRIFRRRGKEALSELYCLKFEMSEAAARYQSSLIDGYPGIK